MTMWEVNFPLQLNATPHTTHAKGFSPVCIRRCISSLLFIRTFPQNSHLFVHFSFDEMHFKFPTESLQCLSTNLERREIYNEWPKPLPMSTTGRLVSSDSFLCNFAVIWLENLHRFLNLHNNFYVNMIWQRRSVAKLNFCRRLAETDFTVMPSAMCMDWLRWCYNAAHAAFLFYSIGVSYEHEWQHKSISPSAIKVKNRWKTIGIKEKLDVISWPV